MTETNPTAPDETDVSALEELQARIDQAVAAGEGVLVGRGKYAIYATAAGGLHLAYRPEGAEEDGHMPIPASLMRMALARGEGAGAFAQIRSLFGAFGG